MKRTYLLVILATLLSVTFGCKPRRPEGVLSPQKLEDVLVDYHLAQGVADNMEADNHEVERYLLVQSVFRKHGLTEAEFDSSLVYYCSRAEEMEKIYGKVMERMKTKAALYNLDSGNERNIYANLTADGDTANIWRGKDGVALFPNQLQNVLQFSIQADSTFRKGDSFIWHMRSQIVSQGYLNDAVAMLRLEYENDTVVCTTTNVGSSIAYDLTYNPTQALDTVPLRNVSGFVYLTLRQENDNKFQMLLLQEISLVRMHKEVELPKAEADSIAADSVLVDSVLVDSASSSHQPHVRLTPDQLREQQPKQRKIDVVKEKPLKPRTRPIRRRPIRR